MMFLDRNIPDLKARKSTLLLHDFLFLCLSANPAVHICTTGLVFSSAAPPEVTLVGITIHD